MIIDRYILKEIAYTLLAVLAVLLLVFVSNRFVRFLAEASTGELSGGVVLTMLGLKTLSGMVLILPLALFLAILLAFSRMYKDSEMIALAACGFSMRRLYMAIGVLAVLVAVLVAAVSFYLSPWAEEQSYRIRDLQRTQIELRGISAGRFSETPGAEGVLYVEGVLADGRTMRNVFIQGQGERGQIMLFAREGYHRLDEATGDQFLVLRDGYRYEGAPGSADLKLVRYREHAVRIGEADVSPAYRKHRARPTSALLGSDDRTDIAEIQWRLALPLSTIFLALLAVPLSRTDPRQGKYAKLFVAVLVYLIYNNMLGVVNTWVARGAVPAVLGMWSVHAALLIGVIVLLARQYGTTWLVRAALGRPLVR